MINDCTVNDMYLHLRKTCELEAKALTYRKLYEKIHLKLTQLQNTTYYCDTMQSGKNSVIYNENNQKNFVESNSKQNIFVRLFNAYIIIYFLVTVIGGTIAVIFTSQGDSIETFGTILSVFFTSIFLILFIIRKRKKKQSKINDAEKQFQLNKIRHENLYNESQSQKILNAKEIEKYSLTLSKVQKYYLHVRKECDNLYSYYNILPDSYRNYISVTTLFYWLDIKRCTELHGHGGLFDTYEIDKKNNEIITELKIANQLAVERNQKLDTVIKNQETMISTLRTANDIAEKTYQSVEIINKKISSIKDYTQSIDSTLHSMNDRDMIRFYF